MYVNKCKPIVNLCKVRKVRLASLELNSDTTDTKISVNKRSSKTKVKKKKQKHHGKRRVRTPQECDTSVKSVNEWFLLSDISYKKNQFL